MKKLLVFVLLVSILIEMETKNVEVPPVKEKDEEDIRLRSLEIMKEPDYEFKSVYAREVWESKNKTLQTFPPCSQQGPQVQFSNEYQTYFEGVPIPPLIIYRFEDIKYSQFLLDILVKDETIYVMFGNGRAGVYKHNKHKFTKSKVHKIDGLSEDRLQMGYFAQADGKIIFMNEKYAIRVEQEKAYVLNGYDGKDGFQTIISIGSKYFAAGFSEYGVMIFTLENNDIKIATQITKEKFIINKNLQLSDLAYFQKQKSLLILDEDNGIYAFPITFTDSTLSYGKISTVLQKPLCDLMYLFDENLYVVCDQVSKISLSEWPKTTQKVLNHPNIKIRQIYANGNILAFVGRNVFKLMYMERQVDYFEDQKMDKLIFTNDFFISANEDGLFVGNYKIIEPYIACQTSNEKFLGVHHLVFKTKAKCDNEYLKHYNIDSNQVGQLNENDMCIYTAYKDVYFWEVGEIFLMPIVVAIIVFLALSVLISIIYFVKKMRLRSLMRELSQYEHLNPKQEEKHQELVEEDPHKSSASNKNDDEEPQELEPNVNEQLHDIE